MTWKDNRRRKRTWYKHYKSLCEELIAIMKPVQGRVGGGDRALAAEGILQMFFELYERRQLHGRKRVAKSAYESIRLAVQDSGLDRWDLVPREYTDRSGRPPSYRALYSPEEMGIKTSRGRTNKEKMEFNKALEEVYEAKVVPEKEIPF